MDEVAPMMVLGYDWGGRCDIGGYVLLDHLSLGGVYKPKATLVPY